MLVNLRRDIPPSGGRYAPVRAGVYRQGGNGCIMLRLSIQRAIAREYGLDDGRAEVMFGYGAEIGEILVTKAGAKPDDFSYRVSKRAGSRDVTVNVSLLPNWLQVNPMTPCSYRDGAKYHDAALHIILPKNFIKLPS